jgi:hypothetical protein
MPSPQSTIIGTIRIEPLAAAAGAAHHCDDSTLDLLLTSFARCRRLDRTTGPRNRLLSRQVRAGQPWWAVPSDVDTTLRANADQLSLDLYAEYEMYSVLSTKY